MRYAGKVVGLIFWAAAAAFILAASAASAQTYPPGSGSLSASAGDTTPAPGSSVDITGVALDANGAPLAGIEATFTITSNPGDAAFSNGEQSITATTDSKGVAHAVLDAGMAPGTIVIRVEAAGLVSQVTLNTGGPQNLPKTGGRPDSGGLPLPLAAGLALLAVAVVAGGLVAGRRLIAVKR